MAQVVYLELFFVQIEKGHGHLSARTRTLHDQGVYLIEKGFQGNAQIPLLRNLHRLALGGIAEVRRLQGISAGGQVL